MRITNIRSQTSIALRWCVDRLGLRWQPSRDTWVAFVSYGLVVAGLVIAFQVFTTEHVAANFIAFGPVTLGRLPSGGTRALSAAERAALAGVIGRPLDASPR